MIDKRDKRFFQLTEQNIILSKNFRFKGDFLETGYSDNALQSNTVWSQRFLQRLCVVLLAVLLGVVYVLQLNYKVDLTEIRSSKSIAVSKALANNRISKKSIDPKLVSVIPAFHVAAIHQVLQPVSLRIADLIESNRDEGALQGSMVVMDKVIVIPKIILINSDNSKQIV